MPLTRKERPTEEVELFSESTFHVWDYQNGVDSYQIEPPEVVRGYQITDTEDHGWFSQSRDGLKDIGGPFLTTKVEVVKPRTGRQYQKHLINPDGSKGWEYYGDRLGAYARAIPTNLNTPNWRVSDVLGSVISSDAKLRAYGTTAIARCSPVSPLASATTTLTELMREGLPSVIGLNSAKSGVNVDKGLAGEHLNYQFGIKPLISDVQSLAKSFIDQDKILRQLHRDSGKVVRRRYSFPTEITTTQSIASTITSANVPDAYNSLVGSVPRGKVVSDTVVKQDRWFSGAFTYHLADLRSNRWLRTLQESERLYGGIPDVADLWNVLPYSWASDWFMNVGDVLQNVSNMNNFGLVMPYGYIMEKTVRETTYTLQETTKGPGVAPLTVRWTAKKRLPASPFGFGITWDGFNSFQLSILAALGITRVR